MDGRAVVLRDGQVAPQLLIIAHVRLPPDPALTVRLAGKLGMSSGPCEAAGTRGSAGPGGFGGPAVKRLLAADEVRVGAGREAELECEQLERRGAGQEGFGVRDRDNPTRCAGDADALPRFVTSIARILAATTH